MTVDQVADRLAVQARTVRRYVHEGRLKAVRIGKQYRIAATDLARLTGQPTAQMPQLNPVKTSRHVEVSTIVQIDAVSPEEATRIALGIGGAIKGRDRRTDTPVRVETIYDETRARLKVIISGSISTTLGLLQMVEAHAG